MLRIIKEAEICDSVEITTNASLMTKDVSEKLVDYGLDILRISVYGVDPSHSKQITQSEFLPEKILENVRYIREYRDANVKTKPVIFAKMFKTYSEEDDKFIEMYKDIADEVGFDEPFHLNSGDKDVFKNLYGENSDNAFVESSKTNLYKGNKACRYPFTHMTIRNDGTIIVCCADWLKELKYGNVDSISLEDAWESKELYEIRCKMINSKGNSFKACSRCEIPLRDLPQDSVDNLDLSKITYNKMK